MLLPVIHRVDKRLSGWVATFLCWGGRLTLINAVLAAIPNYFIACFLWLKESLGKLEKILRGFIWQGSNSAKGGQCLVAWDIVTLPRTSGGLGIRDLRSHNLAMICRFAAKILQASEVPCYAGFASRYCQRGIPMSASGSGTAIWKCICTSIPLVIQSTKCTMDDGTRTSLWLDDCSGYGRLLHCFPMLYSFARNRCCTVSSQVADGHCDIQLHPNLSASATN